MVFQEEKLSQHYRKIHENAREKKNVRKIPDIIQNILCILWYMYHVSLHEYMQWLTIKYSWHYRKIHENTRKKIMSEKYTIYYREYIMIYIYIYYVSLYDYMQWLTH